jgi:uncharacterized protein YdiU (UPF0061 family)
MHHLGVPTTRALSIVTTGEEVVRDMFYDGHCAMRLKDSLKNIPAVGGP